MSSPQIIETLRLLNEQTPNILKEEPFRTGRGVLRHRCTCVCSYCSNEFATTRVAIQKGRSSLCSFCKSLQQSTPKRNRAISATLRARNLDPALRQKRSLLMKGKMAGVKHWNWQGGKSPVNQLQRNTKEDKDWKRAVLERDNYSCVLCEAGVDKANLVTHHIKDWSIYPKLRFIVANGVTVCEHCHFAFHRCQEILDGVAGALNN